MQGVAPLQNFPWVGWDPKEILSWPRVFTCSVSLMLLMLFLLGSSMAWTAHRVPSSLLPLLLNYWYTCDCTGIPSTVSRSLLTLRYKWHVPTYNQWHFDSSSSSSFILFPNDLWIWKERDCCYGVSTSQYFEHFPMNPTNVKTSKIYSEEVKTLRISKIC